MVTEQCRGKTRRRKRKHLETEINQQKWTEANPTNNKFAAGDRHRVLLDAIFGLHRERCEDLMKRNNGPRSENLGFRGKLNFR
ncbi:unnamed protein product, partial [Nesidiocoris tenuis]